MILSLKKMSTWNRATYLDFSEREICTSVYRQQTSKSYKVEQVCLYKQLVLLCLRQIKEIHFCYSLKNLLNTFYESCHFIPARISWLITGSLIITLPMQTKRAEGHRQVKVVHAISRNSSLEQITNFKFRASNISYN